MFSRIVAVIPFLILGFGTAYAQPEGGVEATADYTPLDTTAKDGFLPPTLKMDNAKAIALPEVKQANVQFFKRIWRDVDLRDSTHPENKILTIPGSSLMEVIQDGLKTGRITAYSTETFQKPMSGAELRKAFSGDSTEVPKFDDNGNQVGSVWKMNEFSPFAITKFRVKEDIFYDKQRSKVEIRIVGIAPLKPIAAGGEYAMEIPMFWVSYSQSRNVFIKFPVSDPSRNLNDLTLDDVFIQKLFYGKIYMEENPDHISIPAKFRDDVAAQDAESARIEKEIEDFKTNIWKH